MVDISENLREGTVSLGALRIEGWVVKASCVSCRERLVHYAVFDALFCPACNTWTSLQCTVRDCYLCAARPERPLAMPAPRRATPTPWHRLLLVAGFILAGCGREAPRPAAEQVTLEPGLGNHHFAVSASAPAQQLFDQGLRLAYAFNHPEAERSFRAGAAADPACAMCWWGVALVLGPNINMPMDPAANPAAMDALGKAQAAASKVTDRERAYIEALTARYAAPAPASRAPLDSAYARAMALVARQFPEDLDAQVLYAEALMDLRPWDYWDAQGKPNPGLEELVPTLERVIAADSMNPGACHYYIHAVEKVNPSLAVPCAERLAALMPAAGHLVHMPAHIYARVGRYNDAVDVNEHAVHADQEFLADRGGQGTLYTAIYYPHNYHFLAFASAFAGRSREAMAAAAAASEHTPPEVAALAVEAEYVLPARVLYLATYQQWDSVLAVPEPPANLRAARGMALYARGSAYAATGKAAGARACLDTVQALATGEEPGVRKLLLGISAALLQGNIAQDRGNLKEAITSFERAVVLEDSLPYMEPAFWHQPTRFALGAALLQANRPHEAAAAYRAILATYPESGVALNGLALSLAASGDKAGASQLQPRITKAWRRADVPLAGR